MKITKEQLFRIGAIQRDLSIKLERRINNLEPAIELLSKIGGPRDEDIPTITEYVRGSRYLEKYTLELQIELRDLINQVQLDNKS